MPITKIKRITVQTIYDIVKAHGGEIKVQTNENEGLSAEASAQAGTEFTIQLLIS